MYLQQLLNKPYFSSEQKIAISSLFTDTFVRCDVKDIELLEENDYYAIIINTLSMSSWIIEKYIHSKKLTLLYLKNYNLKNVVSYVYTSNGFIQVDVCSYESAKKPLIRKTLLFLLLWDQNYRLDLIYNYQDCSTIKNITFNYSFMSFQDNKLVQIHYYSTIDFNSRKVLNDNYYTIIPTDLGIFINKQHVYLNDVMGDLLLESLPDITSNIELYELKPSDSQKVNLNNAITTFAMTIC